MLPYFDAEMVGEISQLERELGVLKARRRAELGLPLVGEPPRLLQAIAAIPGRAWRMLRPVPPVQSGSKAPAAHPVRTRGT